MKRATANIYLDKLRPKENGKCSVKIKVTYNRKRKYFSTGIDLSPSEFEKVFFNKRRTIEQKELKTKIEYFEDKAENVIKNLKVFSFDTFKEHYLDQRNATDSVYFAFDKYIKKLNKEKRIGTAVIYDCAKNSLKEFKNDLTFADVTEYFLKDYENWMLENGNGITTVGIYLRHLRAIYRKQKIDDSVYPFGRNKYEIPSSENTKKALTLDEVSKIYNYQAKEKSTMDMAKDYWLFLYMCNGMNVKDFCLLKWSDIDGSILTYVREKTKRNKKRKVKITVALKPESLAIIKKWGQPSLNKDDYIFPHLNRKMSAERARATHQQLTKTINKYIKRISNDLGLDKNVTTYFARHSFATALKRSGVGTQMISDLLGHSNVSVTENYLDSFDNDQIQKQTDILTSGFTKAN